MSDVNKVILNGRLGADGELRHIQNGTALLSLRVVTTEAWGAGEARQEKTEWHSVTVWGKQAEELAPSMLKGRRVLVEGSVTYRSWADKEGKKQYRTEIRADFVTLTAEQRGERSEAPRQDGQPSGGYRRSYGSAQAAGQEQPRQPMQGSALPDDFAEYPPAEGTDDLPF